MIKVQKLGVLLQTTNKDFESRAVLNPAVMRDGNAIHLFYRAISEDHHSTIGYCQLSAPAVIAYRMEKPLLVSEAAYESMGLEDPRIVKIEGNFYLSYTAYNGINALGALATSEDMVHWQKHGIIVPQITYEAFSHFSKNALFVDTGKKKQPVYTDHLENRSPKMLLWDKNLIFFPRKIHDRICFLHRIKPDIQIVVSIDKLEDLTIAFWEKYFQHFDEYVVLSPRYAHESSYVGGGCPPIETRSGWLIIYHGVRDTEDGYVYSVCAALLDLQSPQVEIARLPYPLFFPEKEWELKGQVDNVCFPTGAVVDKDQLFIYYGAADERIAVASLSMEALLLELEANMN
jgi:predicted GH43/DUF377 family glycosyl hydrolase